MVAPVQPTATIAEVTILSNLNAKALDFRNTLAVGLLMTYRCNLRCKYCYIHTKKNIDMSLETAKSIIEPFLMSPGELLDIKFYGGETLMTYDVIKHLVEWVESRSWLRRYRFFGSTNGTLLTPEIKEWLSNRSKTFVLGLSYDGLPSSQIQNRGAEVADVDFFISTWPKQTIQMTINEESVSNMAEGIKYLLLKGATVHPNVAYESTEWSTKYIAEYGRQLSLLIDFYNQHPELPSIKQFKHDILEYAERLSKPLPQNRVCGAGAGFVLYDVDGKSYPCHLLSPLVLGGEKLTQICEGILGNVSSFADKKCSHCPFTSSCPTCMASNFIYRGSFAKRDITHCEIMKLEVKAFMKKEVLRLMAKETLTPYDVKQVYAIRKLNNYFNN